MTAHHCKRLHGTLVYRAGRFWRKLKCYVNRLQTVALRVAESEGLPGTLESRPCRSCWSARWGVMGGTRVWQSYREEMPKQLIVHVGFRQERNHQQLLLPEAKARRAVNVPVQMQPEPLVICSVQYRSSSLRCSCCSIAPDVFAQNRIHGVHLLAHGVSGAAINELESVAWRSTNLAGHIPRK